MFTLQANRLPAVSTCTTAAAAPSPNKAVAMMLLLERSAPLNVIPHSSTTRKSQRDPGWAWARAAARDRPRTPPPHPRPKIGNLCTSRRNGIRSISKASRLGTASPVDETVTMPSISVVTSPAFRWLAALRRSIGRARFQRRVSFGPSIHAVAHTIPAERRNSVYRCPHWHTRRPTARRSLDDWQKAAGRTVRPRFDKFHTAARLSRLILK